MREIGNILVTGGAGFIGVNMIDYLLHVKGFSGNVVNLDALTYAGNLCNLEGTSEAYPDRYRFYAGNICDRELVEGILRDHRIDTVIHLAAESHVDRSISGPGAFIETNITGTFTLLEAARACWEGREDVRFHHVSTDEVFGPLEGEGLFREGSPYDPRSPYAASKASSDHLVRAYSHTYGLPVTISNCANNYGPYQYPEKLIPLMVSRLLKREMLPVYGDGRQKRDWLHVNDHASAIWSILTTGTPGETYLVGGRNELENLELIDLLISIIADETGADVTELGRLVTHVEDRPAHDRRYGVDPHKLEETLGWKAVVPFAEGLQETVRWYIAHEDWVRSVTVRRSI